MQRREFIALLGGAATSVPFAAHAQQASKLPTIGFLGPTGPSADAKRMSTFVKRLQDHGWTEGRNFAIEYRWAEGRIEQFAPLAAALVRLNVTVIVTYGTATSLAAKRATA